MAKLIIILVVTLCAVYLVDARKCYSCNSAASIGGENCKDPFNSTGILELTCEDKQQCAKSVNEETGDVERGCSPKLTVSFCDSDNCNSANSVAVSMVMFIVPAIFALFQR